MLETGFQATQLTTIVVSCVFGRFFFWQNLFAFLASKSALLCCCRTTLTDSLIPIGIVDFWGLKHPRLVMLVMVLVVLVMGKIPLDGFCYAALEHPTMQIQFTVILIIGISIKETMLIGKKICSLKKVGV